MLRFSPLVLFLFCFACNDNKAEKTVIASPPPRYYFYPKANVYFDSVNKDFVFLGNDGINWQKEKQIPAAMQAMLDKNILIDTPAQPVWKDNDRHKMIYSALLYASPADTQATKPSSPVLKETPTEVKKERKGLRKFLDKIFSRKKKDTANR